MSRTQIHLIMENNKNKVNSVVGFNANNDGASFEFFYNKCGNEKQCTNAPNFDFLTEFDINSSLYNTNINELPYFTKETEEGTYTLDDLLDFVSDIPNNDQILTDTSFKQLPSEEPQAPFAEVLMDTALASPLSASSEESCCLDDLLFNDETPAELQFSEDVTEVLDSSNSQQQEEDVSTNAESLALILQENSLGSHTELTPESFDALCALILQNQSSNEVGIDNGSSEISSLPMESPSSPSSSSESDESDVRYSPYKRSKKQKTPEQRQRKKVQNRNAALRYRVKKKDQFQAMNAEAEELEEKNRELKGKVDGLRTEIDYLKNLMLDVIKARLAKGTLPANFLSLALESC